MGKKVVRINENDLRRMIMEGIEQVLNGGDDFERLWEVFEDWMDSYDQTDYPTSYTMKDVARHFYELGLKNRTLNEEGGYDMSTPEGREGARKWMGYVVSQEDPVETAAHNWAYENGLDGDENVIRAFVAGVEYGWNNV